MLKTLILELLEVDLQAESDAELLSWFIWQMADKMSEDSNNNLVVLGSNNNREMLADLDYEVTSIIEEAGFIEVWDRISDEENP